MLSLHFFWDGDCRSLFLCETGSSLSVLSELGHICLVFFLQTTRSGNLFAAFVALLRKRHETSASDRKVEKNSRSAFETSVWAELHESEWEFGQTDSSYI